MLSKFQRSIEDPRLNEARAIAGEIAWRTLSEGRGRVRAVFASSVYLANGRGLCCLGGPKLVDGPLNIRLAQRPCHRVRIGASWQFHTDESGRSWLAVADQRMALGRVQLWRASVPEPIQGAAHRAALRALEPHIALAQPADRRLAPESGAAHAKLQDHLQQGLERLEQSLWCAIAGPPDEICARLGDCSDALIGLGLGLTPSGDDILIGAMLALRWLSPKVAEALSAQVAERCRGRTGEISAAHLLAASRGQAVAPIHALLDALARADQRAVIAAKQALIGHGAHSGADALAGLNCAIAAYMRAGSNSAS